MSHLLKRTKKSCLKIFRKISSSKQLFAKKIDDADDVANNNNNNNNNNCSNSSNNNNEENDIVNSNSREHSMETETSPMPKEKFNENLRKNLKTLPSTNTYHQHENNTSISPTKKIAKETTIDLDEESPNNTILHKLTARLFLTADGYDFHRLQHLRSDTGSEIVQFDVDTNTTEFIEDNIVFEKVKYKDDTRYFRHTPSNSSLDNYRINSVATTPDYQYTREFDLESDWNLKNNEGNQKLNNQFTNFGFQAPKETFMPQINMSLGSKFNGNRQNVIISQELDSNNKIMPVVKWDINGNSLDDDDDLLPHEYLEDFDKRLSKRLAAVQNFQTKVDNDYDNESSDSSLKSSSTTLETWIDEDPILENSFTDNFELTLRENSCLIKA